MIYDVNGVITKLHRDKFGFSVVEVEAEGYTGGGIITTSTATFTGPHGFAEDFRLGQKVRISIEAGA